jgi:hypothetical protein
MDGEERLLRVVRSLARRYGVPWNPRLAIELRRLYAQKDDFDCVVAKNAVVLVAQKNNVPRLVNP